MYKERFMPQSPCDTCKEFCPVRDESDDEKEDLCLFVPTMERLMSIFEL